MAGVVGTAQHRLTSISKQMQAAIGAADDADVPPPSSAGSAAGWRLYAPQNDTTTDQTTAGSIRLGRWDAAASGNGTSASWYEGNIQPCANKGMRLPTLYELRGGSCGYALPTDATVTGWADNSTGVPNVGGNWTWSATAFRSDIWQYIFVANSCATNYISNGIYYRCVVP